MLQGKVSKAMRYIDEENQGVYVENDEDTEKVIMELKEIADTISPMLKWSEDVPTNYEDEKLPLLAIKAWVEREENNKPKIKYQF